MLHFRVGSSFGGVALVSRLLSLGTAMGVATLSMIGLIPLAEAQAAYAGWPVVASQSKRPLFRPTQRVEVAQASGRWRPDSAAPPRALGEVSRAWPRARAQQRPLLAPRRPQPIEPRSGARVSGFGSVFRPDPRSAPSAQAGFGGRADKDLHAAFRPTRTERRPTYEETRQPSRIAPVAGIQPRYMPPGAAYLPPGFGGYRPYW